MDQNANGVAGQVTGDQFAVPTPLGGNGTADRPVRPEHAAADRLRPVPRLDHVAGAAVSSDNLVLNNTVSSIDLTFDRYMDVSTFTPSDVLQIQGPSGVIPDRRPPTPSPRCTTHERQRQHQSQRHDDLDAGDPQRRRRDHHRRPERPGQPLACPRRRPDADPDRPRRHADQAGAGPRRDLGQELHRHRLRRPGLRRDRHAAPRRSTARSGRSSRWRVLNGTSTLANGGVWKLEIVNAGSQTGTLNAWSLAVTPQAGRRPTPPRSASAFPQQELSGTYIVNLNSDIRSMAGDALDSNHNAGLDLLRGTTTPGGATVDVTYSSGNVSKPVPDATSDGGSPR